LEPREVPTAAGLFAVGGGPGSDPRVQVFETATGKLIADFLAYEATFTGGVNAAVGDVNNDALPDLVVGAGVGGGPRVRVFDGKAFRAGAGAILVPPGGGPATISETFVLADFFAFEETQRGGTFVAVGNFAGGTLFADVVVGAGPGGGPRVQVFDGEQLTKQARQFDGSRAGDVVANFFAFESSFRNGVVVSATPSVFGAGASDLVVAPGLGGGPRVRVLDGGVIAAQRLAFTSFGLTDTIADFFAGDPAARAGLFVSTADYNGDGVADVAVGTGPGLPGVVTIYSGSLIRTRRLTFTGTAPGDVLDQFAVSPAADAAAGPTVYSNGVTVGSGQLSGVFTQGVLIFGFGGQGRLGRAQVIRFQPGPGFLTRQVLTEITFDPNFVGGVFVSN
jgi:hypothetical protein